MVVEAKYVHTNLVARDWRKLVEFYVQVFGCKRMPPERKISGQWLDDATGIAEVPNRAQHAAPLQEMDDFQ